MTMRRLLVIAFLSMAVLAGPHQPAHAQATAEPPGTGSMKGAWPVIAGLLDRLEESARLLEEGSRGPAMEALNAALRLAEAGASIASGLSLSAAHDGLETIRQTRRSIQNGSPERAVAHMREAVPRLRRLIDIGLADPASANALADQAARRRAGLRLLDPHGTMLGEIDRIAGTRDTASVVIQTGRWVNTFGFLDLGAEEREVPAEQILFGEEMAVWLEPRP